MVVFIAILMRTGARVDLNIQHAKDAVAAFISANRESTKPSEIEQDKILDVKNGLYAPSIAHFKAKESMNTLLVAVHDFGCRAKQSSLLRCYCPSVQVAFQIQMNDLLELADA